MPTTQHRSRLRRAASLLAVVATVCTVDGLGGASASPPASIDAETRVASAARALAPARRIGLDPNKPIFPRQVEPYCEILDNFGQTRDDGARSHEGIDIMGRLGQEVYAVVDGTLGRQVVAGEASSSRSGNAWRLTARGSRTWYAYMHLSAFAPGLANGSAVTQGQLIGYVGDTGNPGPGNYHLHFEVHPNGGAAANALSVLPVPPGCTVH